jgi:hypothetical protein
MTASLPPAPPPGKKRRPPHRSYDPTRAHDPETLARAVVCHKNGEYDLAWDLYLKLDTESVALGKGPHYHARMMAALLWYQRTSKVEFDVADTLPHTFGDSYRTVTGMLRDVCLNLPLWSDPRYNLGVVLEGLGQIDEAAKCFQRAIDIDDAYSEAWVNLGNCKIHQGDVEAAKHCFTVAESLNPEDPLAKYNLMHALALFGEWEEAYERYEYRYLVPGHLRDHGLPRRIPAWNPDLYVDRLIVTDEQGAGDILQYVRFLPHLEARVGKVFCRVRHPNLIPLLEANYPTVTFFNEKQRVPDADAHIPLMSCISRLQIREKDVPLRSGYLTVPTTETGVQTPGQVLNFPGLATSTTTGVTAPTAPNRIGLCWAGSPTHKRDATRSISWDQFEAVLDVPGCEFVNLTVGTRAKVDDDRLVTPLLSSYLDTARWLQSCDLVITVDTSLLHLAGAMGVPTWGLVAASCDMRWMLGRSDTPWYSSVRLVRQTVHNDWASVILRVRADLEERYGGRPV